MAVANYSAFVAEVRLYVSKCPSPIIEQQVKEAVIALAQMSEAFKEKVTIEFTAGTEEYTLNVSEHMTPIRIQHAKIAGRPLQATSEDLLLQMGDYEQRTGRPDRYFQEQTNMVTFYPTPVSNESCKATVVVKPARGATALPDHLAEAHWETIINGAVGRLASMRNSEWYDPELAVQRTNAFAHGVREAKKLALNDDKSKSRSVRYGGL
jgi:hypothetical protein